MRAKYYYICFIFGVGTGIALTAKYFKDKYRTIADVEIESVKKAFKDNKEAKAGASNKINIDLGPDAIDIPTPQASYKVSFEPEEKKEATKIARREGYSGRPKAKRDEPYVIPPEDFGSNYEYECISLVYYEGDGALVDDEDVLTDEDIECSVGYNALKHFGEYEDDAVHVRNDDRKCDYEILLDSRAWKDVKRRPGGSV